MSEQRKKSFKNKEFLKKAEWCMCYQCIRRFKFSEIVDFFDGGKTAECPKCHIDAVVGDVERDVLIAMHDYAFNFGAKIGEKDIKRIRDCAYVMGQEWEENDN